MNIFTLFLLLRQPPNAQCRWRFHTVLLVLPRRTLQITLILPAIGQWPVFAILQHQLRPIFFELRIVLQGSRTRTRGDGSGLMRTFDADGLFGGDVWLIIGFAALFGKRNDCVALAWTGSAYLNDEISSPSSFWWLIVFGFLVGTCSLESDASRRFTELRGPIVASGRWYGLVAIAPTMTGGGCLGYLMDVE